MSFRAGVGYTDQADSFAAGAEAAAAAMTSGGLSKADVVLLFSTSKHEPQALRDGVRSVVGNEARLAGGWAVGIITNQHYGYGSCQVGVAILQMEGARCELLKEGELAENEEAVGRALGARLAALGEDPSVFLIYDSVNRRDGRMKLNMATPLLRGLSESAGGVARIAGAGLCGDMTGRPTYQWFDHGIHQQSAIALAFDSGIRMDTAIMHGCSPASGYRTVTKAEGAKVLEIDGRPAVEVIGELLGADAGVTPDEYGFFVTLGVNCGDKWADFDEKAYMNRMCLKVDKASGGLEMFEPDLVTGTEVQLMHRSVSLDYIKPRVEEAFAAIGDRKPLFAIYIDCAGRAAAYSGLEFEDAVEVQRAVGDRVPLFGFYSGVEIAAVEGQARPLDWTGVFCLFSA